MRTVTFSRSAELEWHGDVLHGRGNVRAASGAFDVAATFPIVRGDAPDMTTPEELLAAAHAVCFGIGLRSIIGRQGASASRIITTATITAEKGPDGIRIRGSHLRGVVTGLEGPLLERLAEIGIIVERECTISAALRGSVNITHEVVAD